MSDNADVDDDCMQSAQHPWSSRGNGTAVLSKIRAIQFPYRLQIYNDRENYFFVCQWTKSLYYCLSHDSPNQGGVRLELVTSDTALNGNQYQRERSQKAADAVTVNQYSIVTCLCLSIFSRNICTQTVIA